MFDLKTIEQAKNKSAIRENQFNNEFKSLISEAFEHLLNGIKNETINHQSLKSSADKFSEALKLKKTHPEPYLYLSYIFCLIHNKELATKYYNLAQLLAPDLPELKILNQEISKIRYIPIREENKTINNSNTMPKAKISKIQRISRIEK